MSEGVPTIHDLFPELAEGKKKGKLNSVGAALVAITDLPVALAAIILKRSNLPSKVRHTIMGQITRWATAKDRTKEQIAALETAVAIEVKKILEQKKG
jgi:hypothetical protein